MFIKYIAVSYKNNLWYNIYNWENIGRAVIPMIQRFGSTILIGILAILMIIITVAFLPDLFESVHDARAGSDTVSANVTTTAGDNDATITLIRSLYNDSLASVTSISSNVTADTPVATNYVDASKTLTVGGLQASKGHMLTVVHEYDQTDEFTGAGPSLAIMPTLVILGIIGIAGALMYKVWV